jgi:hypothetical protein
MCVGPSEIRRLYFTAWPSRGSSREKRDRRNCIREFALLRWSMTRGFTLAFVEPTLIRLACGRGFGQKPVGSLVLVVANKSKADIWKLCE